MLPDEEIHNQPTEVFTVGGPVPPMPLTGQAPAAPFPAAPRKRKISRRALIGASLAGLAGAGIGGFAIEQMLQRGGLNNLEHLIHNSRRQGSPRFDRSQEPARLHGLQHREDAEGAWRQNVRLKPSRRANSSLNFSRNRIALVTSTSATVPTCGECVFEKTMCSAISLRRRVNGSTTSPSAG